MNIYQISNSIQKITDIIESEDNLVSDEAVADTLEALEGELEYIVEKCVFNTNVSSLTNNGKVVGFTIDMSGCNTSVKSSIKFIANFGSATYFKPKSISSYETTFIGCTGVKEYNEDSTAVNALAEENIEDIEKAQ